MDDSWPQWRTFPGIRRSASWDLRGNPQEIHIFNGRLIDNSVAKKSIKFPIVSNYNVEFDKLTGYY
jgi:hypothetical protein